MKLPFTIKTVKAFIADHKSDLDTYWKLRRPIIKNFSEEYEIYKDPLPTSEDQEKKPCLLDIQVMSEALDNVISNTRLKRL